MRGRRLCDMVSTPYQRWCSIDECDVTAMLQKPAVSLQRSIVSKLLTATEPVLAALHISVQGQQQRDCRQVCAVLSIPSRRPTNVHLDL